MHRKVEPEILDGLRPDDPQAIKSRKDIALLNGVMGHGTLAARFWSSMPASVCPRHVIELGGGDGKLLLSVARRMPPHWQGTQATLLDLQPCVSPETEAQFEKLGWRLKIVTADVLDWFDNEGRSYDAVLANLFLHHFPEAALGPLLRQIAERTGLFTAFEPRRAVHALAFSHMVGMIGCGPVTRNDAPISVRAGFSAHEMSELWPREPGWELREEAMGLFTQAFVARRVAFASTPALRPHLCR